MLLLIYINKRRSSRPAGGFWRILTIAACGLCWSSQLYAQQPAVERPIQDNSFLLEEAYNQEPGVVQHISFFTYAAESEAWLYAFTQEWPAPGDARHQLS